MLFREKVYIFCNIVKRKTDIHLKILWGAIYFLLRWCILIWNMVVLESECVYGMHEYLLSIRFFVKSTYMYFTHKNEFQWQRNTERYSPNEKKKSVKYAQRYDITLSLYFYFYGFVYTCVLFLFWVVPLAR